MKTAAPAILGGLVLCTVLGLVLAGCSGNTEAYLYLNVRERPSWGPNGRIAVAAVGGDGNLYIWTVSETGGSARLMTPAPTQVGSPAGGTHPAYNPAGDLLAFSGRRAATPVIYTMSSTTGEASGLTAVTNPDAGSGRDCQPSWAPNAQTIVYSSNRPDGDYDLWVVTVGNAASAQRLAGADDPNFDEMWPCYDPQGSGRVVFEKRAPANVSSHLYIRNADGSVVGPLVGQDGDGFHDGAPAWSPDGTKVAFHSDRAGNYDIWVIDVHGSGLTRLTSADDNEGFPVWKPDGSRIAFIRGNEVWTMAPDGSDQKRITRVYR